MAVRASFAYFGGQKGESDQIFTGEKKPVAVERQFFWNMNKM